MMTKGATDEASAVEAKIRELDPSADIGGVPVMTSAEPDGDRLSDADDLVGHFSEVATGDSDDQESVDGAVEVDVGGSDIDADHDAEELEDGEVPTFGLNDDTEERWGSELPTFEVSDEPDDAAAAPEEDAASEAEEAVLDLAQTPDETVEKASAQAAYQQVFEADPASDDYIDLGSMILGDDGEKSTRFTVRYEEPSGDEQADFAKMLSQFKEKVSESLGADDVQAHHDLGIAYKEMGLLEEAVGEFQAALRASADHLPTYELLGLTFIEMGRTEAAVYSLERALEVKCDIEDELVGIYYYLARANEDLGKVERAVDLYERVFSIDINFADVTERLGDLR